MSESILDSRAAVGRAVDSLEQVQRLRGGDDGGPTDEAVRAALDDGRRSLAAVARASTRLGADEEDGLGALPVEPLRRSPGPTAERTVNAEISTGFNRRLPWYPRLRDAMLDRRIRTHLISGVEFQMMVFIVGPAVHQILPLLIAGSVGLLGFELVILVKLAMATADFVRLNTATRALADRLEAVIETVDPDRSLRHQVQAATGS
jgi:hypothetical protein